MMIKQSLFTLCLAAFIAVAGSPSAGAQRLSAATNAADWAQFGTANASLQYGVTRHWSITAEARYNPWSFRTGGSEDERMLSELKTRMQSYAVGARFWTWNVFSGWWLGAAAQYQEYDSGGVRAPWVNLNEAGDAAGLVLSGGYALQLSEHWDLDFGLGLWGGWKSYTVYSCPWCGREVDKGRKFFIIPDKVILSLMYIF